MRLPFRRKSDPTWDVDRFIWLENVSNQHILLRLPSGDLRLDMHRRLRFRPDVLDQPVVRDLIDSGRIAISR